MLILNAKDFKEYVDKRLKNKMLWVAVIALVTNLGITGYIELPQNFESLATCVLNILVLLGVINNPSTSSQNIFVDNDLNHNGIPDYLENDETPLG